MRWMLFLGVLFLGLGLTAAPAAASCATEPCEFGADCVGTIVSGCVTKHIEYTNP